MKSVTVITSTIGRDELEKCMSSVANQTHPCRHMVFVNGTQFHERTVEALGAKPDVYFLEEETGDCGDGRPSCNAVFAAAPWLTNADYIFYLNDDDFYEPNHVETLVALMEENRLDWAFSLRRFVDISGQPICEDDFSSLGFWQCSYAPLYTDKMGAFLVDNSCFALKRKLAIACGPQWNYPTVGDRFFLKALKEQRLRSGTTGLSTVNYRVGTGSAPTDPEFYHSNNEIMSKRYPSGFPWRQQLLFIPKGQV